LKGPEADLKKVWLDVVVNGEDFQASAEKRLGTHPVPQGYPVDHIEAPVLTTLGTLNKGEISRVFPVGESFALVKFVDFIPSSIAPLDNLKEQIRRKLLQERYEEAKEKYLKDLRKNATIIVNDKEWTKLKAELIKEQ